MGILSFTFLLWLTNQTAEERLHAQLSDSLQRSGRSIQGVEDKLLLLQRTLAHTEGMAGAISRRDAEATRALALPILVNADGDMAGLLDENGVSVVALRRVPGAAAGTYESVRNEDYYTAWPSVKKALETGDEGRHFSGVHYLEVGGEETYALVVVTGVHGPAEKPVGAIVVGRYLAGMTQQVGEDIGGAFTIYSPLQGRPLASSLDSEAGHVPALSDDLIVAAMGATPIRSWRLGQRPYREALAALAGGSDPSVLAVMGTAQPDLVALGGDIFLPFNRQEIVLAASAYLGLVLVLSLMMAYFLSRSLTQPLARLRRAVEAGEPLNAEFVGSAEIQRLARSVMGLLGDQDGRANSAAQRVLTRDLEGMPASESIDTPLARPELELEKLTSATVLVAELDGMDIAEGENGIRSLKLEATFNRLVSIITAHQGRLVSFRGSTVTAAFGLRPRELPAQVATLSGAHAAMEILEFLKRGGLGDQGIRPVIGLSWGPTMTARLGGSGQYNDVIVGEALREADRLGEIGRSLGAPTVLITEETYERLGPAGDQFHVRRRGEGEIGVKGQRKVVCELVDRKSTLVPVSAGGEGGRRG